MSIVLKIVSKPIFFLFSISALGFEISNVKLFISFTLLCAADERRANNALKRRIREQSHAQWCRQCGGAKTMKWALAAKSK